MITTAATQTVRIPWGAWFQDTELALDFPSDWEVTLYPPRGGQDIGADGIREAFTKPIGTLPIHELARGKRTAAIVVDDLSRPTPASRILPHVLAELEQAGISRNGITIIIGVANHRQLTREEMAWKVGQDIVRSVRVVNHFSWDNCIHIGTTRRGTPVFINALVMAADFKMLVGSVLPHGSPGWAGGAKLLAPGVAGIETARALHGPGGPKGGVGKTETEFRTEVEECARLAGIDAIANAVLTQERGIAYLAVGNLVTAHRAAVDVARHVYATKVPHNADICVLTAYPKDTEYAQLGLSFNIWNSAKKPLVHEHGSVVLCTAASEGAGFHSLMGPGMFLGQRWSQSTPAAALLPRNVILFSPGITTHDLSPRAQQTLTFCQEWDQVIAALRSHHRSTASVAVFPCAAMQIADDLAAGETR